MIEDVFERHVERHRPVPHRGAVAQRLRPGLHPAPRRLAAGRASAASRWPAGTSSARRSASRSTSCSAARCTSGCAPTPTSIRSPATLHDVYNDPDLAAERAAAYVEQGFTARQVRPGRPLLGLRPPPAERSRRSSAREPSCARVREAVGDRGDLLFGTHGQFTPSGAIRLARRLEPYDPLWFEEPVPPEMPEEMAQWRAPRRSRSPPASG